MNPVRTAVTDVVYRGSGEVGDLWCHRVEPGLIMAVYEPRPDELEKLNEGGKVVLWLYTEPIPPISMEVHHEEWTERVAEHGYKVIPELEDEERL